MKRTFVATMVAIVGCFPAFAEVVAPADVKYEDGIVAASLTGMAGDAANGRKVMTTRSLGNCIACHQATALEDFAFHGEVGPSLDGVGDRWTEEELRGIVANAKMMFDGTVMPAFYKDSGFIRIGNGYTGKAAKPEDVTPILNAQQVEDVVAYLMTLTE